MTAPLTLPAKRIVQELCRRNFGWDEVIPTDLVHQWNNWLSELIKLSDFSIDRCLKPQGFEEPSSVQLHHFCDVSEVGYVQPAILGSSTRKDVFILFL